MDAPEVVVGKLGGGWRREGDGATAQRVQALEDRADDAVLSGRVNPLEHQEQASGAFGVEPLLEHVETLVQVGELLLTVILVEPEGRIRAALANARLRPRLHQ